MDFVRLGMRNAQPRFQPRRGDGMIKAEDLVQFEVGDQTAVGLKSRNDSHYRLDIRGIAAPDARLIAAAPCLLKACKAALEVLSGEVVDVVEPNAPAGAALNLLAAAIKRATKGNEMTSDSSEQQGTLTPRVQAIVSPLRACEYCGHQPTESIMYWPRGSDNVVHSVTCTHCGSHGPVCKDAKAATTQWNDKRWCFLEDWDTLIRRKPYEYGSDVQSKLHGTATGVSADGSRRRMDE